MIIRPRGFYEMFEIVCTICANTSPRILWRVK